LRSGPGQGGRSIGEQADAQILRFVDHLAVHLHDPVGDAENELAHDHALEVDVVADLLGRRKHHAGELHFTHAKRTALAKPTQPAEEEAHHLPHRVEAEASRHHWIALEMAFEEPEVRIDVELGFHLALVGGAADLRDIDDAVEHQHRWKGKLWIAWAEEFPSGAGQKSLQVEAGFARRVGSIQFTLPSIGHLTRAGLGPISAC
jgi:hypothetical protein